MIIIVSEYTILLLRDQQYLHYHQQKNHLLRHQSQSTHPPKVILNHCWLWENIHLKLVQKNIISSDFINLNSTMKL